MQSLAAPTTLVKEEINDEGIRRDAPDADLASLGVMSFAEAKRACADRRARRPRPRLYDCGLSGSTALFPVLLRRKGFPDEIFYAARCSECGDLILDVSTANATMHTQRIDHYIGEFEGAEVWSMGKAFACHKACDRSATGTHWRDACRIFQHDQRHVWEKEDDRRERRRSKQRRANSKACGAHKRRA
jgi:hypothetical protein